MHPIWANALMFSILIFGYLSAINMKSSFFPESQSQLITIQADYPGTSPEEIESGIILKIEENLEGIEGIEDIISVSTENSGRVEVFVMDGYDVNEVLTDVKNAVDRISSYPAGAEKPIIYLSKSQFPTLTLALYGNADLWALKERAENFRDEVIAIPGISQIEIQGIPQREIAIEVREAALRQYNLSFDDFVGAVRSTNVDISGGILESAEEEYLIRSRGKKYDAHSIESIVLKSTAEGNLLRVGDVAKVEEKWADNPKSNFYNGKRAVIINVTKTIDEDILYIAENVKEKMEEFSQKHPEVEFAIIVDRTVHLIGRIQLLQKNGILGFILVILSLGFFLNARVAFWVALGIPISFAGMFILAEMIGITINVISLFGMIVVVGMLVDDAIVVAESIYQRHENGESPMQAAIKGTVEVIAPVFTAVFTTIFAFLPFFFLQGELGKIFWQIAFVVIAALLFSLLESLLILPAHLAHSKGLIPNQKPFVVRRWFDNIFNWIRDKLFSPTLAWSLRHKYITMAIPFALLMWSFGMVKGQLVGVSPFPHVPRDNFNVSLSLAPGSQEYITDSLLQLIEEKIWLLNDSLSEVREDGEKVVVSVQRVLGSNTLRESGSHAGMLKVELLDGEKRNLDVYLVSNLLRNKVGRLSGVEKLEFGGGGRWGKPINVSLLGNDHKELKKAAELLKQKLSEYSSLKDVMDNDISGRREINIQLLPKAHALNLTSQEISRQIRQGFFGQEIQRLQRGRDEIRVWVRYSKEDRNSLGKLENMRIRVAAKEYPLSELVKYSIERGVVSIVHYNGKKEIRVEADMEDPQAPVPPIMEEVKNKTVPEVLSQVSGVMADYAGREKDNQKFNHWLTHTYFFGLLAILLILILVFRSYLQSLIIFLMIPTGFIGSILGHFAHDKVISRLSMYGMVALAGIVINDCIVYIDKINKNIRSGMTIYEAIHNAGLTRLRPIMLTTITTVLGLAPLIGETSRQAQYLIPMAISIAWGLGFSSIIILYLVPSLMLALNDVRYYFAKYWKWQTEGLVAPVSDREITRESVEPATIELEEQKHVDEESEGVDKH